MNRRAGGKEEEGKGQNTNLIRYPREKYGNQSVYHDNKIGDTTLVEEESEAKDADTKKSKTVEGGGYIKEVEGGYIG